MKLVNKLKKTNTFFHLLIFFFFSSLLNSTHIRKQTNKQTNAHITH